MRYLNKEERRVVSLFLNRYIDRTESSVSLPQLIDRKTGGRVLCVVYRNEEERRVVSLFLNRDLETRKKRG